ncbi:ABC transporter substrate-binding protein [Jiella pacifica]|uniref:Oligopeptide ABC transporter substrate-binding protein n=1 Tax=Jiella pacifica TaxID=2696469 RepID=A0A6N9T314_9HYPH|nr:ABC transporter substrate-binding protein [Jiella pacifica]NDW05670.1 oligopeptide ABC transporter substrate-binding protein [Jiella pacifica]
MISRALMAMLTGGLLALGAATPAAADADGRPDIVVAVADNPPTLEPAKELSNVGTRITYSVFDTLIRRDFLSETGGGGSKLVPSLATSWKRLDDRTLEVKLREGVKFQNGTDFTADDVVFTFSPERLIGEDSPLPQGRAYFGVLDHVEKIDPYTVRFVTKAPDPLLEQRLASWASWIVNKNDWLEKAKGKAFAQFPVGTGPYMLEDYRADQHVKLKAFDGYWGGKPTARTVTFKKVPEPAARVAGLVSGEFDIIANVAPDQIAQIDGYDDIETRSVVLANSHVLVYNTDNAVLKDKRVRQAMNLAIDRQLLVDALWDGKAVVPNGHQYPEYGDMYQADRPGFEYNPDKARKLLDEAGYKGEEIAYSTEPQYYLNALPAAQAMLEMWKAVGLNVRLDVREDVDTIPNDQLMVRNWSNSTRYPDPVGGLWNTWGPFGSAQKSWQTWAPKEFNKVGHELETTLDHDKRFKLAVKLMDIWEDDAPGTILYQPLETYGVRKSLKWQPYTFYYMDLRPYNLTDEANGS